MMTKAATVKSKVTKKASEVKEQLSEKTSVKTAKEVAKKVTQEVKTAIQPKKEVVITEPVTEKGGWGTDPFTRDWVLSEAVKDLRLKAITQSGNKAYALINDQILEAGEMIQGKRIVSIEKDNVILEQGERRFTLMLGQ